MATTKKIEILTYKLEAKPGALAKVFASFREAKVNVIASWAYQMGPNEAQGHVYASDTAKAKDVLTKIGAQPKTENACYVEDADEVGRYASLLKQIGDAGINLAATDAFAIGGRFATILFVEQKDIPKLCQTLGC
jgi:hypothetical protein